MKKRKTLWRLWAKSLGEKASKDDRESDHIARLRTVIFGTYLITNLFIIAGVIRHWNDGPTINLHYYEVPSHLPETKEENILKANRSFLYN
jgi:hypothetical protein